MGLIEGAVIGGVIGGLSAGYVAWQTAQWQKKFLAALDAGDRDGARRLLEKNAKGTPRGKSFPLTRVLPQRHRLIGLWLLGRVDEVRAELELHAGTGSAAYLTNVHLWGVLARAVDTAGAGGDASPLVAEIRDTAARVDQEANSLQKLLKVYAHVLAGIAVGLAGEPVDEAAARKALEKAHSEPALSRVLLLRTLVVVAERAGKPALNLQRNLAQLTKHFAPGAGP